MCDEEAEFAGGAFGAEVVGELESGAGAGGYGGGANGWVRAESAEGEEASGLVEAEARAELAGGGAEDSAAERRVEGAETVEFDGDCGLGFAWSGADGAAASADGLAGEEELGEETIQFCLPAGLFFTGELGEVGQGLIEIWVVLVELVSELRQELVADAVAGVGGVGVGQVFAPGLVVGVEEGFDLGAAGVEEGSEDFALALVWIVDEKDWVNGAEAFGPGSAEELHEDGFGLVVEGVGGEDGVGLAGGDEGTEEVVADGAGGLFDGLWIAAGSGLRYAVGDAGSVEVEREFEAAAEGFDEVLVGGRFFLAADAVVNVDCGEAYTEAIVFCCVGGVKGEEESYGVCSAGDGYAEAVAGLDVGAVEGKRCGHCTYGSRLERRNGD